MISVVMKCTFANDDFARKNGKIVQIYAFSIEFRPMKNKKIFQQFLMIALKEKMENVQTLLPEAAGANVNFIDFL